MNKHKTLHKLIIIDKLYRQVWRKNLTVPFSSRLYKAVDDKLNIHRNIINIIQR